MKLYVTIYFNSQGATPMDIIKEAEKLGFTPTPGDYDLEIDFENPEQYAEITEKLHKMLKGTKCMYKVSTHRG